MTAAATAPTSPAGRSASRADTSDGRVHPVLPRLDTPLSAVGRPLPAPVALDELVGLTALLSTRGGWREITTARVIGSAWGALYLELSEPQAVRIGANLCVEITPPGRRPERHLAVVTARADEVVGVRLVPWSSEPR